MTYEEIREAWASMKGFDRRMHFMRSIGDIVANSYPDLSEGGLVGSAYEVLVDNEKKINDYLHEYCRLERAILDAIGDIVLVVEDDKVIFVDSDGELVEKDLVHA